MGFSSSDEGRSKTTVKDQVRGGRNFLCPRSPMKDQKLNQCPGNLILLYREDPGGLSSRRKYLSPSSSSALIQSAIMWSILISDPGHSYAPRLDSEENMEWNRERKRERASPGSIPAGVLDDTRKIYTEDPFPALAPVASWWYQKQYWLPLIKASTFIAQCVGLERSFGECPQCLSIKVCNGDWKPVISTWRLSDLVLREWVEATGPRQLGTCKIYLGICLGNVSLF